MPSGAAGAIGRGVSQNGLLEPLSWFECGDIDGVNIDGFTGLHITANSGSPILNLERSETRNSNITARLEFILNNGDKRLQEFVGLGFTGIGDGGNLFNYFAFIHKRLARDSALHSTGIRQTGLTGANPERRPSPLIELIIQKYRADMPLVTTLMSSRKITSKFQFTQELAKKVIQ